MVTDICHDRISNVFGAYAILRKPMKPNIGTSGNNVSEENNSDEFHNVIEIVIERYAQLIEGKNQPGEISRYYLKCDEKNNVDILLLDIYYLADKLIAILVAFASKEIRLCIIKEGMTSPIEFNKYSMVLSQVDKIYNLSRVTFNIGEDFIKVSRNREIITIKKDSTTLRSAKTSYLSERLTNEKKNCLDLFMDLDKNPDGLKVESKYLNAIKENNPVPPEIMDTFKQIEKSRNSRRLNVGVINTR